VDTLKFSWTEWLPWRKWRVAALVDAADEVPERLPPRVAVMVGSIEHPKWLAFDCPCGDSHRIIVSLDPRNRPHWKVSNAQSLSLRPSIDAWRGKRRCHYVIKDGRVRWV
jgi:hypothetical protein